PLPLLRRRFRSRSAIIGLSAIFTWLACAAPYLDFRPRAGVTLMAAMRAALFLLSFFYFDLLAAIICITALTLLHISIQLLAQASRRLHTAGSVRLPIRGV